jgi:hypothetical protein
VVVVRFLLIAIATALALSLPVLLSARAHAAGDMQNPDRLRGEMFIAGATLVDPPPEEVRDTHAYLTISGDAARRLYNTLKVPASADLCLSGRRLKRVGNISCSVGGKARDARCDFGLNLTDGSIAPGLVC